MAVAMKRFLQQGLDALETHRPGQPPPKLTTRLRAKVLNATRRKPAAARDPHHPRQSAHKTKLVAAFLQQHPNLALHFTPTYSSWLNQVELWFSKIQRDVIARGIFTSVADLKRKILRYGRLYQKTAKPFQWKYSDVRKRIPKW